MRALSAPPSVRLLCVALAALLALALGACAGLPTRDPLRISVVGLEPLPGEGLEMRFDVRLRVQNPNDTAFDYDGVALELELNGKPFATGVSDQRGSVPRFGETVLHVPVTVSALSIVRQAIGLAEGADLDDLPYVLRGKFASGAFGTIRFTDEGRLSLPPARQGGRAGR